MDASVEPCVDFYGYARNNWPHNHRSMADLLDDQVNRLLIAIMIRISLIKLIFIISLVWGARNGGDLRVYLDISRPGKNLEWRILVNSGNVNASQWPAERFDFLQLLAELLDNGIIDWYLQFQLTVAPNISLNLLIMPSNAARLMEEEIPIKAWPICWMIR